MSRQPNLQTQLAIALFGWQWRDDWQYWCPPGWPSRDVINAPYLDKLHAQPGIQSMRFIPLPIPPDSLRGVRPWRCEIVTAGDRVVTGEDTHHQGALCYAVLALAEAIHYQPTA